MASARIVRRLGSLAAVFVAAGVLPLAAASADGGKDRAAEPRASVLGTRSLDGRIRVLRQSRLGQSAVQWRGGPVTTSTGETVDVRISEALTPEQATPEAWAEFMSKLVHGAELASLTTYLAPLSEVRQLCGLGAIGCYSRNTAISTAETTADGTTPEEVVRHEYGHHIALNRVNTPWRAIDWGPKRWASAANVCARVARKEAVPGDEGSSYARNPGEAWAEVYRLMDERKAGVPTGTWQIISPSFYPDEAALQAAERDVVEPWTGGRSFVRQRAFARKGQVWWIPLATPLDGSLAVRVTLPKGGQHDVALVSANRRTVLRRAVVTGQRARTITTDVCGQRSPYVRVIQKGALGRVTVSVSLP